MPIECHQTFDWQWKHLCVPGTSLKVNSESAFTLVVGLVATTKVLALLQNFSTNITKGPDFCPLELIKNFYLLK